jgi:hypothetical protein
MTLLHDVEAALLRNVLDTAAHDVGSISSALALHADVLTRDPARANTAAIVELAAQLRLIGRQLREMRGPSGAGELAPTRAGTLTSVHERLMRFGRSMLGRGAALHGSTHDGRLTDDDAHGLTFMVLAALRHAKETAPSTTRTVNLDIVSANDVATVTLTVHAGEAPVDLTATTSQWWEWATARAAAHGFTVARGEQGEVHISVPLDQA